VNDARGRYYKVGGGALVLIIVVPSLFREFAEPHATVWDIFLALFLAAVVIAAVLLQRFFVSHAAEIGEARFDTRNKADANG
jgi:cobalamin biosynthesis protein CobD/CbiB